MTTYMSGSEVETHENRNEQRRAILEPKRTDDNFDEFSVRLFEEKEFMAQLRFEKYEDARHACKCWIWGVARVNLVEYSNQFTKIQVHA